MFCIAALLLCMLAGNSQKLITPTNLPIKPHLPSPKIPALTKPDLEVTDIRLISDNYNSTTGVHTTTISLTIKNAGQLPAPASYFNIYCRDANNTHGAWQNYSAYQHVAGINGGASLTAQYVLIEKPKAIKTSHFSLWAQLDISNMVQESNEMNNGSPIINVGE